jgi:Zn-dependent protease with chaperone function
MQSSSDSAEIELAKGAPSVPSRLNPFAFVSDTSLRFVLLLIFVISAGVMHWFYIGGNWTYIGIGAMGRDPQADLDACLHGTPMVGPAMFETNQRQLIFTCLGRYARQHVPFMLGGFALMVAVTLALYTITPVWIRYRWRASALLEDEVPGLWQELLVLVSRARLRRAPLFLWNPLNTVPDARAFGAFGRGRIIMTGGLVAQCFTEPAAFRAVVLHELAHLRNGDVAKAMLTMAVWGAFIVTVLPPLFVVVVAKPFDLVDNAYSLLRVVAFAAVVLLTRNAVLRARELYADARASVCELSGLASILEQLPPMARWRRFTSPHPLPARRRALLKQTDELFGFGMWDAFGLGSATGFSALLICFIGSYFIVGPDRALGSFTSYREASVISYVLVLLVPLSVVVLFGVATAGLVTWRGVFQAVMRGRRGAGTFGLSFAFSGGVVASVSGLVLLPALDPTAARYAILPPAAVFIPLLVLTILVAWVLFGTVLTICLSWFAGSAAAWLPLLLRRGRPGAALATSIAVTCLLAALTPLVGATVVLAVLRPIGQGGSTGLLAGVWHLARVGSAFPFNLVVWPGMIVLWAWPLAPALLAHSRDDLRVEGWAWIGPGPPQAAPPLALLCPGQAALLGLACGLAVGLVVDRLGQFLPEEWARTASLHGEAVPAHVRMMLAAILVQVIIAALAFFAVPRLRPVHALLAANVAGLVIAIAIQLHLFVSHGWGRPGLLDAIEWLWQPIIIGGAVSALTYLLIPGS